MEHAAVAADDDNMNDTTNQPDRDPPLDGSNAGNQATATAAEPAPPLPPPVPPQQRLYRDPTGPIAGVATGIARFFGIDPLIVQVAFVVGTILGGAGIWLYIALWLTLPTINALGHLERPARWKIVIGVTILVLFAFGTAAAFGRPGGGALAVILIAIGVVLLNQTPGRGAELSAQIRETLSPPPPTIPPVQTTIPQPTGTQPTPTPYAAPARWGAVQPEPVAVYDPPPPRLPIATFTLATASIVAGMLLATDRLTAASIGGGAIWGAFALICGVGLIVSAFTGRGAWLLLVPAAIGLIAMASVNVEPDIGDFSIGEVNYVVDSPDQLEESYSVTVGQLTLDLSDLTLDDDRRVQVRARAGEIRIIVPEELPIDLQAEFDAGEMNYFDETIDDTNGVMRRTRGAVGDEPTLTIEADINVGQLVINNG